MMDLNSDISFPGFAFALPLRSPLITFHVPSFFMGPLSRSISPVDWRHLSVHGLRPRPFLPALDPASSSRV